MNPTLSYLKSEFLKVFGNELPVFIFLSFSEKLMATFQLTLVLKDLLIECSSVSHFM